MAVINDAKLWSEINANADKLNMLTDAVNAYLKKTEQLLVDLSAGFVLWEESPFSPGLWMGFDKIRNSSSNGWHLCLKREDGEILSVGNSKRFERLIASKHMDNFVQSFGLALEDEIAAMTSVMKGVGDG